MLLRASKFLIVLALTFSLGLHWIFLQSVAWAGMVVSYSRCASLQEAISKTFDGAHPCKLCKLVRAGQETEKKHDVQKELKKFDLIRVEADGFFFVHQPYEHAPTFASIVDLTRDPPPAPPPRAAIG